MSSPPLIGRLLKSGQFWALVVAGVGVLLGLFREFLIVKLLGFTNINDQLQVYLSVIYVISLFNEAVRLGAINMLHGVTLKQVAKIILPIGLGFAALSAIWMEITLQPQSHLLLIGATVSGWLNMSVILLITARQRSGKFWAAHLINVLNNLFLIPGILIIGFLKPSDLVIPMATLYFSLPLIQIPLLLMIKVDEPDMVINPQAGTDGRKLMLTHSVSALGALIFQGALRMNSLAVAEGELSKVSIAIRIYDSIRFVIVDTFIGKKLAAWKEKRDFSNISRYMTAFFAVQGVTTLIAIGVAIGFKATLASLIILVLSLGSFGVRLVYIMFNAATINRKLIWSYGLQDIGVAVLLVILSFANLMTPAYLILAWYLVKPLWQMFTVRKAIDSHEFEPEEAPA
ncbi:MAG: hypothetical protein KDC26_07490 [Armatimonadetes bacterium]|nr:hypothetical protein [Armatimonadota bacterium]